MNTEKKGFGLEARFARSAKETSGGGLQSANYGLKTREEYEKIQSDSRIKEIAEINSLNSLKLKSDRINENVDENGVLLNGNRKRKLSIAQAQETHRRSRMLVSFEVEDEEVESTKIKPKILKSSIKAEYTSGDNGNKNSEESSKLYEQLIKKLEENVELKRRPFSLSFSFFNGRNHFYTANINRSMTVLEFLEIVCETVKRDFPELKSSHVTSNDLMFVKDDKILPNDLTFFELVSEYGAELKFIFALKEPPLERIDPSGDSSNSLNFRKQSEMCEPYPGKVCLRNWYFKNRHIFPATKWSPLQKKRL